MRQSKIPTKGRFFIELFVAFIVTRLPFIQIPFKWLESYFHELSHGLATLMTGGSVSHIQLFPNGAGLCFSQGGWPVAIGFSGYFGAALWGFLLFILATSSRGIRVSYGLLGVGVLLTIALWGRDLLTIVILLVLAGLFLLPLKLKGKAFFNTWLRIMALMIMLNAFASPTYLLGIGGRGDAAMLASQTWIPAWIWVAIWLLLSGWMLFLSWRRVCDAKPSS
ncbi:M50 family metallopeptidase [uncultured Shewanella sp.]|uniref:M50 family metallopeptidase n=1 Tax=uncultured Shewanella sp. TaxID=173975 RepID=UPI002604C9C3|nr:M50 family metallopeptidase [uncultured Shewanella sp.]